MQWSVRKAVPALSFVSIYPVKGVERMVPVTNGDLRSGLLQCPSYYLLPALLRSTFVRHMAAVTNVLEQETTINASTSKRPSCYCRYCVLRLIC